MSTYSETSSVSWFTRIKTSFAGVLIGLALIVACVVGLFKNEGRAVTTARSLTEGAGVVVSVDAGAIDAGNEGRLVHIGGPVVTDGELSDPTFAVSARGVRLIRNVEMYQWKETSRSEKKTQLGGGEQTVTTYSYAKDWSSTAIDSSRFKQPEGRSNPPMEITGREVQAQSATLGAFTLGPDVLGKIGGATALPITADRLEQVREAYGGSQRVSIVDGRIYLGYDPARPAIGDYRVAYRVVPLGEISAIGRQTGTTLAPYQTDAGDKLLLVDNGRVPADQMFSAAQSANTTLTWILRAVGLLLLAFGFSLVMKPIAVLADVLPFLGSLVRAGTGVIAAVLAMIVGPLTIAVAWFVYRPLVSVIILVVASLAAAAIAYLGKRKSAAEPTTIAAG